MSLFCVQGDATQEPVLSVEEDAPAAVSSSPVGERTTAGALDTSDHAVQSASKKKKKKKKSKAADDLAPKAF